MLYIAGRFTPTNVALVDAFRAAGVHAGFHPVDQVLRLARAGDSVLPRLDVVPSLDGVEPGLEELGDLERRGVLLVNGPGTILSAHDKLMTALRLGRRGLPHPRTLHVDAPPKRLAIEPPLVVKPRFGSWGQDVVRCESERELHECLHALRDRPWFRRQGALVQELVPPQGYDIRVLVAGGRVVGAVKRVAAEGEWRTNIALGGRRAHVTPPPLACSLAVEAAAAVDGGFVGIDLLPTTDGHYSVIEVNGCVDFTTDYSFDGDVHLAVVSELDRMARMHALAVRRGYAERRASMRPVPAGELVGGGISAVVPEPN
jgi:tetrahydromethanopterin:alpha-L-glutamate ligase